MPTAPSPSRSAGLHGTPRRQNVPPSICSHHRLVSTSHVPGPAEAIAHAEMQIGDSRIMLSDEVPDMNFHGPKSLGGTPVRIYLYVEDVDGIIAQAAAAGAKILVAVEDQFWGDRTGTFEDPFGHVWNVSTHKEDFSAEELARRAAEYTRSS